jgi:hypothetical protein
MRVDDIDAWLVQETWLEDDDFDTDIGGHHLFRHEAIDFVLTFPQAELDVNIWMYLPIGFQVDTDNESKQSCLLKLNKSLYGLKHEV